MMTTAPPCAPAGPWLPNMLVMVAIVCAHGRDEIVLVIVLDSTSDGIVAGRPGVP